MNNITFDLFPGGKKKAVTFSYDDGKLADKRLADIFDKYGAKCTFNLNSCNIGKADRIDKAFVRTLSERHEIACHAFTHPFLEKLPLSRLLTEIYEDKKALEDIIGKPVCGMAYPYGSYDEDVKTALRAAGILYSRTTVATSGFLFPRDFLEWHPTCHHDAAPPLAARFNESWGELRMLYVWGHSYEFDRNDNWDVIEQTLQILSQTDDKWYATNIELYDYLQAVKNLRVALNEKSVYNPSAVTVYATVDGKPTAFASGLTVL